MGLDVAADELALQSQAVTQSRCRIHEAEEENIVQVSGCNMNEQVGDPRLPSQQRRIDEREVAIIAGGVDHHIELRAEPILEMDSASVEAIDIAFRHNVAMADVVEDLGVHERVRALPRMIGLR